MFGKKKKIELEKESKIDYLIQNGYKELEILRQVFNTIDQKVMWFFTFASAIQGYLIVNYFINKSINFLSTKDSILILVLTIGFIILGFQIYILKGKIFATGPNILKQTNSFKEESKSLLNLKSDTLGSLNESINENHKVISNKAKYFRYSINILILYFLFIIIYFLILTFMGNNNDEDFPTTSSNTGYQENGFSGNNNDFPTTSENTQRIEKTFHGQNNSVSK